MPRYTDADALYEQTAEWEARALARVEELNRTPLDEMTIEELEEWRKWSYILHERSTFKYDVADTPTADVVERKRGKWEHGREVSRDYIGDACVAIHYENWRCSNCNYSVDWDQPMWNYCPNCGADMRGDRG